MTTLERMAKAACMAVLVKLKSSRPETAWEDQSPENKELWVAAIRAALEVIRERPPSPTTPMNKPPMRATPLDFWQAVIDTILEEKP
jgi:hypothetical protein